MPSTGAQRPAPAQRDILTTTTDAVSHPGEPRRQVPIATAAGSSVGRRRSNRPRNLSGPRTGWIRHRWRAARHRRWAHRRGKPTGCFGTQRAKLSGHATAGGPHALRPVANPEQSVEHRTHVAIPRICRRNISVRAGLTRNASRPRSAVAHQRLRRPSPGSRRRRGRRHARSGRVLERRLDDRRRRP